MKGGDRRTVSHLAGVVEMPYSVKPISPSRMYQNLSTTVAAAFWDSDFSVNTNVLDAKFYEDLHESHVVKAMGCWDGPNQIGIRDKEGIAV